MWTCRIIERFFRDESGATSLEYGLIASLIAVGAIPVVGGLGSNLSATFGKIAAAIGDAPPIPMSSPPAPPPL